MERVPGISIPFTHIMLHSTNAYSTLRLLCEPWRLSGRQVKSLFYFLVPMNTPKKDRNQVDNENKLFSGNVPCSEKKEREREAKYEGKWTSRRWGRHS